ncbi:Protein of unknown function, partial [Gryllus bimaculatus]
MGKDRGTGCQHDVPFPKDFNKGHPETSKRDATAHNQKQFTEKRSYGNSRGGNSRGFGQNNTQQSSQNTQQSSSWFGLWGSSSSSSSGNVKTNYNGSANSRGSSGRGNYSHSRGRGGGRGNGRGRGSSRVDPLKSEEKQLSEES